MKKKGKEKKYDTEKKNPRSNSSTGALLLEKNTLK